MLEAEKKLESKSSKPGHKWKILDGQKIESSTFPPFKGLVLEEDGKQSRAIPLVMKEESQLPNTNKRIQKNSKQINL